MRSNGVNNPTAELELTADADCVDGHVATPEIVRHIYVHIPFCARICPYCAFYKERADPAFTQRFCEAVVAELKQHATDLRVAPETIFFGGGTPTALTTSHLEFLLGAFHDALDLSGMREWTFEANPGSVSRKKAVLLRSSGVSRISLGVQSLDDGLLRVLGRDHDAAQAERTFAELRDAGFENLNVDLMFGIPGQTEGQWRETLQRAVSLGPDHISAYCLTYEEDTDFFLRHARGEFRSSNDADAELFETTMEVLEGAGFQQYEISNYARPGKESVHNRAYWAGADYLGIGPSAVSTVGSRRWKNLPDYRGYSDRVLSGESIATEEEQISVPIRRGETIALSLRTRNGVPAEWLRQWPAETQEFSTLGLLEAVGDRFVLTRRGRLLADSVAEAFI
jgi:oxygen-independent coproporphyrinogen-3 oxidase